MPHSKEREDSQQPEASRPQKPMRTIFPRDATAQQIADHINAMLKERREEAERDADAG